MNMKKARRIIQKITNVMEFILAISVIIALVITAVRFIPGTFQELLTSGTDTQVFYSFVEDIFYLVIGIEFAKMLCQPDAHNVIEVLLFLVSRHMIIGHNNAVDNLLSVVSIALLFLLERYLKQGSIRLPRNRENNEGEENK